MTWLRELLEDRLASRRDVLKYSVGAGIGLTFFPSLMSYGGGRADRSGILSFKSVPPQDRSVDKVAIPEGFGWNAVIKWGDPLFNDTPGLDITNAPTQSIGTSQNVERQKKAFGYNNDFLGIVKTPDGRYILLANHEYTNAELMFANFDRANPRDLTLDEVRLLMEAHGISVVEIRPRRGGGWEYVRGSKYNRRITATTPIEISGPLKEHKYLRTSYDQRGEFVYGTLNNCSGGITPWNTLLSCEENWHVYFTGNRGGLQDSITKAMHERYGIPESRHYRRYQFTTADQRFDINREPNEPHRFGYVVELDPFTGRVVKRTALGRFRHEAATCVVAPDGRVVVYMGDDRRGERIYKFVTKSGYNPKDREANWGLLDEGTLYVAKFEEGGRGRWIALATCERSGKGFRVTIGDELKSALQSYANDTNRPERTVAQAMLEDPAFVFLYTQFASDVVNATKLERPEDVEWNPKTKSIWACLTYDDKNTKYTNPVTPRRPEYMGYILEIKEANHDPTSASFTWDVPIFCGVPGHWDTSKRLIIKGADAPPSYPPISAPDNITFDSKGNVWIATDGNPSSSRLMLCDGTYVFNPFTGELKAFMFGPAGSEICGPLLLEDKNTYLCAIQHPGEGSSVSNPSSLFPYDGSPIPRPSVIAIYRRA